MEELEALVALNEVEELRGNKLNNLYEKTGNFSSILRAYNRSGSVNNNVTQYKDMGIDLVPVWDKNYPSLLLETEGNPLLLYVKGDVSILKLPMMAVVGSRVLKKTDYKKIKEIVKELVKREYVIVSGLARGTDGMVHRAAMELGGKTIAVVAHGLDIIYPPEHKELMQQIIKNGAVISEMPLGVGVSQKYFLARNRIIVGMSEGLVVVEADIKSGSMASANWAAEMGREVFAVPGTDGCDLLIQDGAIVWK